MHSKIPYKKVWDSINWQPGSEQLEQFEALYLMLCHYNKTVNLTRLVSREDYWISQVFDSIWPIRSELKEPNKSITCIDVGTGCGFPGLAIAIALPKAKLTLVDSVGRKTSTLKKIVSELDLDSRVSIRTERIEVTGQSHLFRATFDLSMARAVAVAPVIAEYLLPLLKPKGEALIYRGKWNQLDQKRLTNSLKLLNADISIIHRMKMPSNRGIRHVIRLKPNDVCPSNYPRSVGIPSKRPL